MLDVFRKMAEASVYCSMLQFRAERTLWQLLRGGARFGHPAVADEPSFWNETNCAKEILGVIRRETQFQDDPEAWWFQGPIVHVGQSVLQAPRRVCSSNKAYDYQVVDLTFAAKTICPALTTLRPWNGGISSFASPLPLGSDEKSHVDFYRLAFQKDDYRLMDERSTISGIFFRRRRSYIHGVKALHSTISATICLVSMLCHRVSICDFLLLSPSGRANLHSTAKSALSIH